MPAKHGTDDPPTSDIKFRPPTVDEVWLDAAKLLVSIATTVLLGLVVALSMELITDPDSTTSRVIWYSAGAFLVNCSIERDWRASAKSLVWGRNVGVLFFALGCAANGFIDYLYAAWPALAGLAVCLLILRWSGERRSAVAEAAKSVLGWTAIGMNVVLAILLVLTVATLESPLAGYFEARFIRHYSAVHSWLDPPVLAVFGLLTLSSALQRLYPKVRWLRGFRQVKGLAGKVAGVLWLVALMVFTGTDGVKGHGARRVASLSWKYNEQLKRLASADGKPAAYQEASRQLAQSGESERKGLHDFAVTLAEAADCGRGHLELRRGVCRNGMSEDAYRSALVAEVARAVVGQNLHRYGTSAPKVSNATQIPGELQRLATNAEEDRVQQDLLGKKTAEADAAEAFADRFGTQVLDTALEAIHEPEGLARILISFLKELLSDYARKGLEYLRSQFDKELLFPTYWRDASAPETDGFPIIDRTAREFEERDSLPNFIERRIEEGKDRMRADIER
jgi:hypothetical protein